MRKDVVPQKCNCQVQRTSRIKACRQAYAKRKRLAAVNESVQGTENDLVMAEHVRSRYLDKFVQTDGRTVQKHYRSKSVQVKQPNYTDTCCSPINQRREKLIRDVCTSPIIFETDSE